MKTVLLIITGSIAAYKSLDVIRQLKEHGVRVRCILSYGAAQFITPLSVAALSNEPVYQDLFSLKDEAEMGHIRLTREADAVVVSPASANIMAKLAHGLADDLASATLLASDKLPLIVPAMNTHMWLHPATRRNLKTLQQDGAEILMPQNGTLACGEEGEGKMAKVEDIVLAVLARLAAS